jgi:hypothetical protein
MENISYLFYVIESRHSDSSRFCGGNPKRQDGEKRPLLNNNVTPGKIKITNRAGQSVAGSQTITT